MIKSFALLLLVGFTIAAIPGDLVGNMPQWPTARNFSIYSGLLNLSYTNQKQIHYVLITKTGQNVSNNYPLALWLNGGPGCSSLIGMLTENGPYVLEGDNVTFNGTFNIWSWNNAANILYFESPAGVGFSPSNVTIDPQNYNDYVTAQDNFEALQSFYQGFPELKNNDFWITGESYAGIYIPFLAALIDDSNNAGNTSIPLKGIMSGNGVIGISAVLNNRIQNFYDHHLFSQALFEAYNEFCLSNVNSNGCKLALNGIAASIYGINPYDLYGYCYPPLGQGFSCFTNNFDAFFDEVDQVLRGNNNGAPACIGGKGIYDYLNNPLVMQALHVNVKPWNFCSNPIGGNYSVPSNGSIPQYYQLMNSGKYTLVLYSGDVDGCIPFVDTEYWIGTFGLNVTDEWRPWYAGDQVAGMVTLYDKLTYVTVKGAGHMVPAVKRQEAYIMFSSIINNQPLPYFTPSNCEVISA